MYLRRIIERKKVEKTSTGARYFDEDAAEHLLTGNEVISRNLWGFQPSIFNHLKLRFKRFLKERSNEKDSELFIPTVVDELIEKETAEVKVLHASDNCFSVTYRRDADIASNALRHLIEQGLYPENLWEQL